MDSLVSKSSLREVQNALKTLPTQVNATYDEVMVRVSAQNADDKELANKVLSWIVYAHRPLSLQELQCAIAISTPDMLNMDPEALVDEFILIDVCAGMVIIDEETSIIRLIHKSPFECDTALRAYL